MVINNRSGDLTTKGNIVSSSTIYSSSPGTGALIIAGGAGINGNLNIGGSLTTPTATMTSLKCLTFNNMCNITIRGYSNKTSGVASHSWTSSQGTTSTANNFSIILPTNCISMCSQYSYYTTNTYSFQGITPYYYSKASAISWVQNIDTTIGSFNAQPSTSTITGTDPFIIIMLF